MLPSDHGASPNRPWDNTIDIGLTRTGIESACKAGTICWLVDACRNDPIDMLNWPEIAARPLYTPAIRHFPPRVILDLRPTVRKGVAHGPPGGGVSYFTEALIRCLDRLGASSSVVAGGRWCVTTESLRLGMEALMKRTPLPDGSWGECDVRGSCNNRVHPTILHTLPGPARVLATITYHPEPCARVRLLDGGARRVRPAASGSGAGTMGP